MKSKMEDLTKQNDQLISEQELNRKKSQSLTQQVEKLTAELSKMREQSEEISGIDANKKVRLAQDQMAKVMAKDRRELQEWISKCNILEQRISTCKVCPLYV